MPAIYFLQSKVNNLIKIGCVKRRDDLDLRLRSIQLMSPVPLIVLGTIDDIGRHMEKLIHHQFVQYRLHGEWFKPGPELLNYINEHAQPVDEDLRDLSLWRSKKLSRPGLLPPLPASKVALLRKLEEVINQLPEAEQREILKYAHYRLINYSTLAKSREHQ